MHGETLKFVNNTTQFSWKNLGAPSTIGPFSYNT